MDEELHAIILARASGNELGAAGRARGMRPLKEVGLAYVEAGVTSASEVARVLGT